MQTSQAPETAEQDKHIVSITILRSQYLIAYCVSVDSKQKPVALKPTCEYESAFQLNEEETENPVYSSVTPNKENIVNPRYSATTNDNSEHHYKTKSVAPKPVYEYAATVPLNKEETENPAYMSVTSHHDESIVNPGYSATTNDNSEHHSKTKSVAPKPVYEYAATVPLNKEETENPAYTSITSHDENIVNPGYSATTNDNPEHHYEAIPYHTVSKQ